MNIGAWYSNKSVDFTVWAPLKNQIEVKIVSPMNMEQKKNLVMDTRGYWHGVVKDIEPLSKYTYIIDGKCERPDPVSFYQSAGVHKQSTIINHDTFSWEDHDWQGILPQDMIQYELHIGTFSRKGTFDAVIDMFDHFIKLGVNTIEIMPVSQFPGDRNWGYDGVYPFAVQNSYGGPEGLKRLVNACHQHGIAVVLDVVYNHLGPEGNYFGDFGPYFTQKYHTPWGWAINFDDQYCHGVRNLFIQNALYWFEHFHIDALRIDAVHGIYDSSAKHILKELSQNVAAFNRVKNKRHLLIAESDLNDSRIIDPREKGGYGLHAQWLDDFHHSLRTIVTNDSKGYYGDFGQIEQLAKAYREGFVYDWKYSSYRKKYFGNSSKHIEPKQFVVFTQNHDQIGNRMIGERLTQLTDFESLKLAAGAMIFSPYVPMLFMGEEFAADSPFCYFISHLDINLVNAVREGRKREFAEFQWKGEPPDAYSKDTYNQSKLNWDCLNDHNHKTMFEFYCKILQIRKNISAFRMRTRKTMNVSYNEEKKIMILHYCCQRDNLWCYMNFRKSEMHIPGVKEMKTPGNKILDSADVQWGGPGSLQEVKLLQNSEITMQPRSLILFSK